MPKPKPGSCVHCSKWNDNLTWDHVLPKSWYPDTTPPDLEKWKFPSCERCNNEFSELERDLFIRIGLCLDRNRPECRGIVEKVLRTLNPDSTNDLKEKEIRLKLKNKYLSEIEKVEHVPAQGVLPSFGKIPGTYYPELRQIKISQESLKKFTRKLVRGITWVEEKRIIKKDRDINTFVLNDQDAQEIYGRFFSRGNAYYRGPGWTIWRCSVPEDSRYSLILTEIWGRFRLYGAEIPSEDWLGKLKYILASAFERIFGWVPQSLRLWSPR